MREIFYTTALFFVRTTLFSFSLPFLSFFSPFFSFFSFFLFFSYFFSFFSFSSLTLSYRTIFWSLPHYFPVILDPLLPIFYKIYTHVARETSDEGVIRYHRDTKLYQSCKFLQDNEEALSIILYSDVVSLTNPLGYAKSKHNILQFYFTLCEMRSWERSKIQNIFNIAFIDYKKGKPHLDIAHSRIVSELRKLEGGVQMNGRLTKFAVLNYLGDNLESHYIAGLQTHFHAGYVCRLCTIQHKQLENVDEKYPCRTIHDYNIAITRLQEIGGVNFNSCIEHEVETVNPDELQHSDDEEDEFVNEHSSGQCNTDDEDSADDQDMSADDQDDEDYDEQPEQRDSEALKGWKRKSPYNELKSFSTLHSLPLDALHDVHEGLLSYDIPCILKYFVRKRWFNFDELNQRLKDFPYSRDMDKPAYFLTKNKQFTRLPGKGMASGLLVQILPFLIMNIRNSAVIRKDDVIFKMLQQLHRILELTMSEVFDKNLIDELDMHIRSYFSSRKEKSNIFCSMKPKHHHILHLAESISYHGPPTLTWTARHESKHTESTNIQRCSKNFKNVTLSLSKKSQLRLASRMYTGVCAKSAISERGNNLLLISSSLLFFFYIYLLKWFKCKL